MHKHDTFATTTIKYQQWLTRNHHLESDLSYSLNQLQEINTLKLHVHPVSDVFVLYVLLLKSRYEYVQQTQLCATGPKMSVSCTSIYMSCTSTVLVQYITSTGIVYLRSLIGSSKYTHGGDMAVVYLQEESWVRNKVRELAVLQAWVTYSITLIH